MFTLFRYFSVASLAALLVISLALGWLYRTKAVESLLHLERSKDIALTRAFSESLWPQLTVYLAFTAGRSATEILASPEYAELFELLRSQAIYVDVVNIKIYDVEGRTIFSAIQEQVGQDQQANPGFASAMQGEVTTELTFRNQLNGFDGVVENRDVLGAYVPLYRVGTSEIIGVFELYTDVTPLLMHINGVTGQVFLLVGLILAALYIALLGIVRYAETILRRQYQERVLAEEALSRRLLIEERVSAIALSLARVTPDDLHHGLHDALSQFGDMVNADYALIYLLPTGSDEVPSSAHAQQVWSAPHVEPLPPDAVPDIKVTAWLTEKLAAGTDQVTVTRDQLVEYMGEQHPLLLTAKLEELLLIPIRRNSGVVGFLALGSRQKAWCESRDLHVFTSLLAGIFASSIARIQAGMELAASQQQLEHIISSSPSIIYTRQPAQLHAFTFVSTTIHDVLQHAPEHVVDDPEFWPMLVHPDDLELLYNHVESLRQETRSVAEYRIRDGQGSWHWLRDEARLRRGEGPFEEIVGTWTDITDSKLAEAAIHRRNEYLHTLHSVTLAVMNRTEGQQVYGAILREAIAQLGADDGLIALFDDHDHPLQIQASTLELPESLTWTADISSRGDAARSAPFVGISPPDTPSAYGTELIALLGLDATTVYEASLQRGDRVIGLLLLVRWQTDLQISAEDRELLHHFATLGSVVLDHTQLYASLRDEALERWRAEVSLSQSEERFRTLIQSMDDTVFTMDKDGRYTAVLGRSPEAKLLSSKGIISLLPEEFWPPETAEIHRESANLALNGQPVVFEWELDDPDSGTVTYIQTSLSPIKEGPKTVSGLVGVNRNITALRQAERAKNEFIANVSHELRTPLASILGFTEVLLNGRPGDLTATQHEFLNIVFDNGKRLKALVDDLLDVSHLESGNFSLRIDTVDLADLVQNAISALLPLAEKTGVSLEVILPEELASIEADAQRLAQALDNLLSNAVKFSRAGGRITLETTEEAGHVCISVSDTGIGMDEHDLANLFSRFHRGRLAQSSSSPGTGLGLYITKAIVEGHGGTIEVQSVLNEGTTFRVRLPVMQASAADTAPATLVEEMARRYYSPNTPA